MPPKVSIIIPAYNEEKQIERTLRAALAANPSDVEEIIVVNDCSTDRTQEIVESVPGIRLINNPQNGGKSATVATGIRAAKGEFILFLDADLIGLSGEDITALYAPVRDGEADVAITMRENTPGFMKRLGIDFMSGERVMRKSLLSDHLDELAALRGYGIEVFLNRIYIAKKCRIRSVLWSNVRNDLKFTKRGFLRGLWLELLMWGDIFRVVSPFEAVRQNLALRSQRV